jgi:hypothetical protein
MSPPRSPKRSTSTPFPEEALKDLATLIGHYALRYFDPMVPPHPFKQGGNESKPSAFQVFHAIDQAPHPCVQDGSQAHHAGFNGHIEGASGESIIANLRRGFPQSQDLGVGRWIGKGNGPIVTPRQGSIFQHQYRSYRDFPLGGRPFGFLKRLKHIVPIGSIRGLRNAQNPSSYGPEPKGKIASRRNEPNFQNDCAEALFL